jgi:hypothetical protein
MHSPTTKPMIIGAAWSDLYIPAYVGEPGRPLLFRRRTQARAWCAMARERYADGPPDMRLWRFKEIKVSETVKPI